MKTDYKTADKFLDATLVALKDGMVYQSADGKFKRAYEKNSVVGEVFSWVDRPSGVWWNLKEGGWVKHEAGKFDMKRAENSSSQKKLDRISELQNSSSLPYFDSFPSLPDFDFMKYLKWAGLALLLFAAYSIYKTLKK
jgi:hypothetical protein